MTDAEKYKLSTYATIELLHNTKFGSVELVKCSVDEKFYIKKTYYSDKRALMRALSNIDSPYLPKIYDIFFSEDTIVIEENIIGTTIEKLQSDGKVFSRQEINSISASLIQALSILHDSKIIHRDIKPGNIIVKDNGQAVLIDFSISRMFSDGNNADTELLGTLGYAAPEQYGFSQSDYRTDIYAFGITMKGIISKKNTSAPLYLAIQRCAEFDPSRRFQTVTELKNYISSHKIHSIIGFIIGTVAVVSIFLILVYLLSASKQDILTMQNNNSQQAYEMSEIESVTEKPIDSLNSTHESIIYDHRGDRIVNTGEASEIPCIKAVEGEYVCAAVSLSDTLENIQVEIEKNGSKLSVSINGNPVATVIDDGSVETADYPDGENMAEVVFYDLNCDGTLDIIPVMANALAVDYLNNGDVVLLKNYSVAWCIYYDDDDKDYHLADGRMQSRFEDFKIYNSYPGCLWADMPSYYTLQNGSLIQKR